MRLHLVDGTFELFRAHCSRRPGHVAPAGWDAKATVGLVIQLLALLHDEREQVTHVAVAFDNPIRSFRNDLWHAYKTEDGVPRELLAQFHAAEDATRALGVAVWRIPLDPAGWPARIRGRALLAHDLEAGREAALHWRRLATLVDDVPLPESLEDLRWRGIPRGRFERWCAGMGARALLPTLRAWHARWDDEVPGRAVPPRSRTAATGTTSAR